MLMGALREAGLNVNEKEAKIGERLKDKKNTKIKMHSVRVVC